VEGGVAHDSPAADLRTADLELRLDQGHDLASGRKTRQHRRQDQLQRDEGYIDHRQRRRERQCLGAKVSGVAAIEDAYPRVLAQRPVQLGASDVESDDLDGAAGQEDLGEPAGRCPDVEDPETTRVDAERAEHGIELAAAATYPARPGVDLESGSSREEPAGFVDATPRGAHAPGEDEGLGLVAVGREPERHEEGVGALPAGIGRARHQDDRSTT
jgi:hypothetical protein